MAEESSGCTIYDEYARKIWLNEPYVRADHVRWHSSGYHIREKTLDIDTAIEDVYGCLDICPEECGIDVDMGEWHEKWMEDPKMIAAMAKLVYQKLKHHDRYAFDDEPNWIQHAREYLRQFDAV